MKKIVLLIFIISGIAHANFITKSCSRLYRRAKAEYSPKQTRHAKTLYYVDFRKIDKLVSLYSKQESPIDYYIKTQQVTDFHNSVSMFLAMVPKKEQKQYINFLKGLSKDGRIHFMESWDLSVEESFRKRGSKVQAAKDLVSRAFLGKHSGNYVFYWGKGSAITTKKQVWSIYDKFIDFYVLNQYKNFKFWNTFLISLESKNPHLLPEGNIWRRAWENLKNKKFVIKHNKVVGHNSDLMSEKLKYDYLMLNSMGEDYLQDYKLSNRFKEVLRSLFSRFIGLQYKEATGIKLTKSDWKLLFKLKKDRSIEHPWKEFIKIQRTSLVKYDKKNGFSINTSGLNRKIARGQMHFMLGKSYISKLPSLWSLAAAITIGTVGYGGVDIFSEANSKNIVIMEEEEIKKLKDERRGDMPDDELYLTEEDNAVLQKVLPPTLSTADEYYKALLEEFSEFECDTYIFVLDSVNNDYNEQIKKMMGDF